MAPKRRRRFARRVVRKVPKAVKQYVARAIHSNEETKYLSATINSNIGPVAATTVVPYFQLFRPGQGSLRNQRIGNEIAPKGLKIKGLIRFFTGDMVQGGQIRILVGYNRSPLTLGTVSELEAAIFSNATATANDQTQSIRDKDATVKILLDRLIRCDTTPTVYSVGQSTQRFYPVDMYIPIKNVKTAWNDSGSTPQKNDFFMYMCSNSIGSTAEVSWSAVTRFYYKDA
jgi:hypothetical protein